MQSLTGIIIAKNEEELIADAIDNLNFCDEVIVVDGGSDDKTREIAEKMKARVIHFETDDFSAMRNIGKKHAKGEWILYIDADERLSEELKKNIQRTLENPDNKVCFRLKRKNYYFLQYEWPFIESLERLFKAKMLEEWYGKLHESPKVRGEIGSLPGYLYHYTHRDLSSMLRKTIDWSSKEAKLRYDAKHPKMTWWRFPRVMMTAFYVSYIRQKGYAVGVPGLIESIYQSFSMFITYAKLWELQNEKK